MGLSALYPSRPRISVGMATCGLATKAADVYEALRDEAEARGLDVMLVATGCLGYCQQEPLVDVQLPGRDLTNPPHWSRVIYARMTPDWARDLIAALETGDLPAEGALAVIPPTPGPSPPELGGTEGGRSCPAFLSSTNCPFTPANARSFCATAA